MYPESSRDVIAAFPPTISCEAVNLKAQRISWIDADRKRAVGLAMAWTWDVAAIAAGDGAAHDAHDRARIEDGHGANPSKRPMILSSRNSTALAASVGSTAAFMTHLLSQAASRRTCGSTPS
jgi:hypothetical protein